jgi:hypothetical protein
LGTRAFSVVDVLCELVALRAASRGLVEAPRALVLAVDMVRTDDALPDEPQPRPATVATDSLVHGQLDLVSTVMLRTRIGGIPYYSVLLRLRDATSEHLLRGLESSSRSPSPLHPPGRACGTSQAIRFIAATASLSSVSSHEGHMSRRPSSSVSEEPHFGHFRDVLLGFSFKAIRMASLHMRRNSSKRSDNSSEASYLKRIDLTDCTS